MTTDQDPPFVRRVVSSRGNAVAVLSGYLFGVFSFYTNFFDNVLQATAVLVDCLAVITLIWLAASRRIPRIWRSAGPLRTLAGATLAIVLLGTVTYYGVRPPVFTPASAESCLYDVTADGGVPIPLQPGGSVAQELRPGTDRINSVSVIAGIDRNTADPQRPHAMKLLVRTKNGRINVSLSRDDIADNAFSRFEFPEPLRVRPREPLLIQAFNESNEQVSIYVKQPGPTDMADTVADAFVQGHVGNPRGYRKTGYVLSGCLTRPGGK